ncbi:Uma2 family endonuclease [Streptomyces sp. NBC_01537]|uniref:Uma2 family endonuclease n=1 Tax=Streptomyces sp. NBC_01537 TaxID=2903896 RepID=UPI0038708358
MGPDRIGPGPRVFHSPGVALRNARVAPYGTNCERCVLVDELNVPKPDVVIFDRTGLDVRTLGCVPVASTVLAVEVVSVGSRSDDRFRKPGMYAAAGVDAYWRVERGTDDIPVVHEFRLGILRTDFPYPVEIDLRAIVGDL